MRETLSEEITILLRQCFRDTVYFCIRGMYASLNQFKQDVERVDYV